MAFRLATHDSWGVIPVGDFATLEEARRQFASLCQDPWYRQDGTVKGIELQEINAEGDVRRLDWFGFS